MSGFEGFRANSQKTAIPNVFFTQLMPQIKDAAELRIVLHVFWAVQQKKGSPRFVTFRELLGDKTLAPSLGENLPERVEALESGLRGAVERGVLISTRVEAESLVHELYMLNTLENTRAMERMSSGGVSVPAVPIEVSGDDAKPNIFSLYENNIGLLTPLISEEIEAALRQFSEEWIREAVQEAVRYEARSWRYIEAILRKWKTEGKTGGTARRHSETGQNTDRYFKGKYGHLVQRRFD